MQVLSSTAELAQQQNERNAMKKCVICRQEIKPNAIGWEHGNNAQPVAEGQCCDECNFNIVLPRRISIVFQRQNLYGKDWK